MEELVELILKINKDINKEISSINCGGCGIFASKMYKQLEKLGYKPKIMILDCDDIFDKKEMLNNKLNKLPINGNIRYTSFAHCCLEVAGLYFDGVEMGQKFLDNWTYRYPISGTYTIEELDLALKVGGWDRMFNRRKRNPTLNKIIRKAVKQTFPMVA